MVNTIHRSVVEKLQVEVANSTVSDDMFVTYPKIIETNEQHFKECLKNNVACYVNRETFVVEHDIEKNKIIFKKYIVRKASVMVEKLKTLKLKTHKSYNSLSIDITTGEFSIYKIESGTRKKRKPKPTIRQTVFTNQVISIIDTVFDVNLIDGNVFYEGINKGLNILGYNEKIDEIITEGYLKRVFRDDNKKLKISDYFGVFIMLNYFRKLNLILPEACSVLEYARDFRNDKKNYSGKSMYAYYAKYFDTDEEFVANLFGYKEQLNTNVYYSNKGKEEKCNWYVDNTNKQAENNVKEIYYTINENALTILYKLGYTSHEIKNNDKLFKLVYYRDNTIGFYHNPSKLPLDILIEYKTFFKSMVENKVDLNTITKMLNISRVLRDVYGIKVNMDIMYYGSINGVLSSLAYAVEKTGLYAVSQTFLNRLKKQLPKGSKCSITKHINKKMTENSGSFSWGTQDIESERFAAIILTYRKERMRLMVRDNFIATRVYKKVSLSTSNETKNNVLEQHFSKFDRNYNKNKNKLKYAGLKAHYSKKEFERMLKEKYSEKNFKLIMKDLVYLK
jgi:hypothetical protein